MSAANEELKKIFFHARIKIDFLEKGKTRRGNGKHGPIRYFEFFDLLMLQQRYS